MAILQGWCTRSAELLSQLSHPAFVPKMNHNLTSTFKLSTDDVKTTASRSSAPAPIDPPESPVKITEAHIADTESTVETSTQPEDNSHNTSIIFWSNPNNSETKENQEISVGGTKYDDEMKRSRDLEHDELEKALNTWKDIMTKGAIHLPWSQFKQHV